MLEGKLEESMARIEGKLERLWSLALRKVGTGRCQWRLSIWDIYIYIYIYGDAV